MNLIHPTAIVHPKAALGRSVRVGAYTIIEENVIIGADTIIMDHVHIGRNTLMGKNNVIHMGAIIGHEPQIRETEGVQSGVEIGDDNVFREYTTIHYASKEGSKTRIGNQNFFMAFSHIGHDCEVGDHVTAANATALGGHVSVENSAVLSVYVAIHQFCRVGRYAMVGGHAVVVKDVPPYMTVSSNEDRIASLNLVGLRRSGLPAETIRDIKQAYRFLYHSSMLKEEAIGAILQRCQTPEARYIAEFVRNSKRGILTHRRRPIPRWEEATT